MDPLTKDERDSFRAYALDSRTEPDGSECQWASYTLRLLEENERLRAELQQTTAHWVDAETRSKDNLADKQQAEALLMIREENAHLRADEAKLKRVVEILKGNHDSANRCLNEADHPAWVHAQAHATISVCETALAAAKGE